ncbi:UDP-N-acetylmuramoyl-tripeptide--D-alanyl-D-alanine ligase [Tistrella bauzanensis]|uniref:UDP-N-acetylmuramoyl-tripeptide--D-alanyl-D-alanine ligase n=1 Tax=Tistrella arctica TaxID=3133430 RepID=A0ABU9YR05_9PROT
MTSASPILWTAGAVAAATGGRMTAEGAADAAITGVAIDSREVRAGDLFIALRGDANDGHDYAVAAEAAGAAVLLVDRAVPGLTGAALVIICGDTMAGLQALGAAARARFTGRMIAVTGSVGKTGTRGAIARALASYGRVHQSVRSFNNHWGVPLSLARMPADAAFAVLELGMNHAGEIDALSRLARPHVALITKIAPAHLGNFDGEEAIADAKAEIFNGLEADGVAVLNRDSRHFDRLAAAVLRGHAATRVIDFATSRHGGQRAVVRLVTATPTAAGTAVAAEVAGLPVDFIIGVPGAHWVENALAVLGVLHALGLDPVPGAAALAGLDAPVGRGTQIRLPLGDGQVLIVDETYNANPESMRAAICLCAELVAVHGGRLVAVLGDMLELGDHARRLHEDLTTPLVDADAALVYTAGPAMAHLHDRLDPGRRAEHGDTSDAVAPAVVEGLMAGDVVLVKGSRGMRMERVIVAITAALAPPAIARKQTRG